MGNQRTYLFFCNSLQRCSQPNNIKTEPRKQECNVLRLGVISISLLASHVKLTILTHSTLTLFPYQRIRPYHFSFNGRFTLVH